MKKSKISEAQIVAAIKQHKAGKTPEKHPTEGQDLYYRRIRKEGLGWNYKRCAVFI